MEGQRMFDETHHGAELNQTFDAIVMSLHMGATVQTLIDHDLELRIQAVLGAHQGRLRLHDLATLVGPDGKDIDDLTAAIGRLAENGRVKLEDSWIKLA